MTTYPLPLVFRCLSSALLALAAAGFARAADGGAPSAQATPAITIDAGLVKGRSSPILYGLMTEEINYSYDGGLYGELIANRAFQDSATEPAHWSASTENGATATLALDRSMPLNNALRTSLRFDFSASGEAQRAGLSNGGFGASRSAPRPPTALLSMRRPPPASRAP